MGLTQAVLSILGCRPSSGWPSDSPSEISPKTSSPPYCWACRPFQIGDYVTVAGQSGVVKSLNTRATVWSRSRETTSVSQLGHFQGDHGQYDRLAVHLAAHSSWWFRIAPSTVAAIDAITRALNEQKGILRDPPPRAWSKLGA